MTTIRDWFDSFTRATGETVKYVVLGQDPDNWDWSDEPDNTQVWGVPVGEVMHITYVTDSVLDREFDDGYGGNRSPNLCAWSDSYVIFSDTYDGAESVCWVPKAPTPHLPIRPGG